MGNCCSKQISEQEDHLTSNVTVEKETNPIVREAWQGRLHDHLSLTSVSPDEQDYQRNETLSPQSLSAQGNSQVANPSRNESSQRKVQDAISTRSASSYKICEGSQDRLSLQSVATDSDLNSTTLDLSLSNNESVGETIRSLPSACSVHVDPDESRHCSSISTFKNSQNGEPSNHNSTLSLPSVSSSGFLDIEAFASKINDQVRNMTASRTSKRPSRLERALSVIRRLDAAVVNAMNKVQNFRSRTSSRVAPMAYNEPRLQTPVSDGCSDVIVLSD